MSPSEILFQNFPKCNFFRGNREFLISFYICRSILNVKFKARGGSRVKKTSLAYIKVQPVMELLLFTESQNLRLWRKYGASKFRGITQSHTKYKGVKWPKTTILEQYFQKYLSLTVQTCLKVRFYQVLHVSVSFMCRNVQILKIWAKNGQKDHFSQEGIFLKIRYPFLVQKWC